jgi:ABC-type multidrug transport system ATPase subunit
VAVMSGGQIIAIGRPEELGGRDVRPAEIRFSLSPEWSLGDVPDVPCEERSQNGDRVAIFTREPVAAAQRITAWAVDDDVDLGHFSVSQPTLEDIYLELTGSGSHNHTQAAEEVVR